MEQAVHPVVDDLARRHDNLGRQSGEMVGVQIVEDRAIIGDERLGAVRVENVHGDHSATPVSDVEDVCIAPAELGQQPGFGELNPVLVAVRFPEDGTESRALDLRPDVIALMLDQLDAVLRDVGGNQRDACEDGVE